MKIKYCCEKMQEQDIRIKWGELFYIRDEDSGIWIHYTECPFCHAPITIKKAGEK